MVSARSRARTRGGDLVGDPGPLNDAIRYSLDRDDVILRIEGPWTAFAEANAAPDLKAPVGGNLFDYIAGHSTRAIIRHVLDRLRAEPRTLELPFRCDAPDRRRYMRLRIESLSDGSIEMASWVEREEPRSRIALLDIGSPRTGEMLRICSWCKRVDDAGKWLEVEVAIERLGLFGAVTVPAITHGMCPSCEADLMRAT